VTSCGLDSYLDYYPAMKACGCREGWTAIALHAALGRLPRATRRHTVPISTSSSDACAARRSHHCLRSRTQIHWDSVDRIAAAAGPIYSTLRPDEAVTRRHPDCVHDFRKPCARLPINFSMRYCAERANRESPRPHDCGQVSAAPMAATRMSPLPPTPNRSAVRGEGWGEGTNGSSMTPLTSTAGRVGNSMAPRCEQGNGDQAESRRWDADGVAGLLMRGARGIMGSSVPDESPFRRARRVVVLAGNDEGPCAPCLRHWPCAATA